LFCTATNLAELRAVPEGTGEYTIHRYGPTNGFANGLIFAPVGAAGIRAEPQAQGATCTYMQKPDMT
jgi:hypothetical protein